MPFRIENILKKDDGSFEPVVKKNDDSPAKENASELGSNNNRYGSILHQTLLNRLHPTYCRSTSENYQVEKVSMSFHPYGCERVCYPQGYYNPYFDNDYPQIYTRSRLYPMYSTSLPSMIPLQYSYYSKRKGGQVRFTASQTDILEKRFLSHKYLSPEDRKLLADDLKLSDRQVKTWFQNRRAKWRRSSSSSSTEHSIENERINDQNDILNTISR